ncbi:IS3 family transposase [Luteolibacter sp. SL250]|nr:IS3 family transposase [Luteolibacter sp. SL250]WAC21911.1 IS3 family transposase [Luteolibacter sp. SL250]
MRESSGASLRRICSVLGLPRSTYHHKPRPPAQPWPDQELAALISTIFHANRRCYGYRRIACELANRGVSCGWQRARRMMRRQGLHAIQRRRFTPKTSDGKASHPCANLLAKLPPPQAPDQVWAGDITLIPSREGWLYLAVVIDLWSRRIIGWSLSRSIDRALVTDALRQALQSRRKIVSTIFHSDRGSQYSSTAFRAMLAGSGLRQSMSRLANPYDNARTESFMGTLKAEMAEEETFRNLDEARQKIFSYIDAFYNPRRLHSSIGYLSPNQFEARFQRQK